MQKTKSLSTEVISKSTISPPSSLESWLQYNVKIIVFVLICLGFIIRLHASTATYLNPDEALHYLIVNQPTVFRAYEASLTNAHPPLYFIFLYFWRFIGNTELVLRLPSVISSTVFVWILYKWLKSIFNTETALIGMLIATFSPALIALASEVRAYSFLLLFMVCCLYFLECSLKNKSKALMVLCSLFLLLAILTHYSALWFTVAIVIYTYIRLVRSHLMRQMINLWVIVQFVIGSLYSFLYTTHISKLHHGALEKEAMQGWLRDSYFGQNQSNIFVFISNNTSEVFYYLFSHPTMGIVMLLTFLSGIGVLIFKKQHHQESKIDFRQIGILLFLPLAITCLASIIGVYPYGATRHIIFLIIFVIPVISFLLEKLTRDKILPILLAAIIFIPVWQENAVAPAQNIKIENQYKQQMNNMLEFIQNTVPKNHLIFVDYQTDIMLGYYLGRNQYIHDVLSNNFLESSYSGRRIISSNDWSFDIVKFSIELDRLKHLYNITDKQPIWIVQAGWGSNIYYSLRKLYSDPSIRGMMFGDNLMVFQIPVNLDLKK